MRIRAKKVCVCVFVSVCVYEILSTDLRIILLFNSCRVCRSGLCVCVVAENVSLS